MKKLLIIGLFLLISISSASAAVNYNTTNVITNEAPTCVGGTNVVTVEAHYIDQWFSLYNQGSVTYMVYVYDYVGDHDSPYHEAFIGAIEPGQMAMLNGNASYRIYASYDHIRDLGDVNIVKQKFNQWWLIIVIALVIIMIGVKVYKVIIR